jgi:hypothetical protein
MNVTRTSAKVREAAQNALKVFQRPFSIPEFEEWLGQNDRDLASEIAQKCYDYVRVILSLAPQTLFVKYTRHEIERGQRRRMKYFGAPDGNYDPNIWTSFSKRGKRHRSPIPQRISPPTIPNSLEPSFFFGGPVFKPLELEVDDSTCDYAWFALQSLMPSESTFWGEFERARTTIRTKVEGDEDPAIVLRTVLNENPSLTHAVVAEDVVHILSRDAIRARQFRERPSTQEQFQIELIE